MRAGLTGTDAYLDQWRKSEPVRCSDDLKAEVERVVAELEAELDPGSLRKVVENGGFAPSR